MKQLPNFNLWVFRGDEVVREKLLNVLAHPPVIDDAAFYVGHEPGSGIVGGPYKTEDIALFDARAMTDTSGT